MTETAEVLHVVERNRSVERGAHLFVPRCTWPACTERATHEVKRGKVLVARQCEPHAELTLEELLA